MKDIIKSEFLAKNNINIENEQMSSGESRFRVRWSDDSAVNITNCLDKTSWQNAHYHKTCKELYIVQRGKILVAIMVDGNVQYKELKKGETLLVEPLICHNVYMYEDSMTYVVKFGDITENDWFYDETLDIISKKYVVG